jgi:hypothetical protein
MLPVPPVAYVSGSATTSSANPPAERRTLFLTPTSLSTSEPVDRSLSSMPRWKAWRCAFAALLFGAFTETCDLTSP